jgi:hypothetical protein
MKTNPARQEPERDETITFRVSASVKRRIRMFAASHDMRLGELLQKAFEEYEAQHGRAR